MELTPIVESMLLVDNSPGAGVPITGRDGGNIVTLKIKKL